MRSQSATRNCKEFGDREAAVSALEKDLRGPRVNAAAQSKAAEMVAAERQAFEQQLAWEKDGQVAELRDDQLGLRKEREQLKDEKAGSQRLEVQKQVDAQIQHREAVIRAQEQEQAQLREEGGAAEEAGRCRRTAGGRSAQDGARFQAVAGRSARTRDRGRPAACVSAGHHRRRSRRRGSGAGMCCSTLATRTGQAAGTILLGDPSGPRIGVRNGFQKLKEDMRACGAASGFWSRCRGLT